MLRQIVLVGGIALASLEGCASTNSADAPSSASTQTSTSAPASAPAPASASASSSVSVPAPSDATVATTAATEPALDATTEPAPAASADATIEVEPQTTAATTALAPSPTAQAPATPLDPTATSSAVTSADPTTPPSSAAGGVDQVNEAYVIGASNEGRPITAVRRGTPGGRRVLVIGVIHGDEAAGLAIVDELLTAEVPAGVDLWLVDSMNPDGVAAGMRHNANQVDLNRNFPYNWGPIAEPGNWEYAGPSAASEPETQAMVQFITDLQPDLTIWYHQDYNRIAPAQGRDGVVRARYAELTGVPLLGISGGTYTGVAATWARKTLPSGVAFIVELGESLSTEAAAVHAAAILTIATEPI